MFSSRRNCRPVWLSEVARQYAWGQWEWATSIRQWALQQLQTRSWDRMLWPFLSLVAENISWSICCATPYQWRNCTNKCLREASKHTLQYRSFFVQLYVIVLETGQTDSYELALLHAFALSKLWMRKQAFQSKKLWPQFQIANYPSIGPSHQTLYQGKHFHAASLVATALDTLRCVPWMLFVRDWDTDETVLLAPDLKTGIYNHIQTASFKGNFLGLRH